jgi:hypothetical protein
MSSQFALAEEAVATIPADRKVVFDYLDDHANLSSHMSRRSWMMLGTRMDMFADGRAARAPGSLFGFSGRILGIPLRVEQKVTRRDPPSHKEWETVGAPRLWVIGPYRMGFECQPFASGTRLRVFLDYDLPESWLPRLLGRLFGKLYARWCVARMVSDAAAHFVGSDG